MLLKCLECIHKSATIGCLKLHYTLQHEDKIGERVCVCGDKALSGICANNFSPWGCSFKDESNSNSNSSSSSNSNSSSSSNSNSNLRSSLVNHEQSSFTDSSPNPSSSSSSNSNSIL